MDRALRGVTIGLIAMFAFLTWGILVTPAGLLVKLVMFFLLSVAAFGITLVMTTESPLADAVLQAPWDEESSGSAGAGQEVEATSDKAAERPARPRARAAARAGRAREAEKSAAVAATGQARETDDGQAE